MYGGGTGNVLSPGLVCRPLRCLIPSLPKPSAICSSCSRELRPDTPLLDATLPGAPELPVDPEEPPAVLEPPPVPELLEGFVLILLPLVLLFDLLALLLLLLLLPLPLLP